MRSLSFLLACCSLVSFVCPVRAGTVESRLVWVEGKPQLELTIDAEPSPEVKEIDAQVELHDAQGSRVWNTTAKIPSAGPRPWKTQLPLPALKEPNKQHRLSVSVQHDLLGLEYQEKIYFGAETAPVQTFGLRSQGAFPQRKITFVLGLNAFKGSDFRDVPVNLSLRDGDDVVVLNRQQAVRPANEPRRHVLDVTPPAREAVGPFKLEVDVQSEGYSLYLSASERFGFANALVPVSSMEHGDPTMWYAADGKPQSYRSMELYPPGQEAMYYSEHLRDLQPRDNPRLSYDTATRRSGRQALRMDYQAGTEANAWSFQYLPGKPLHLVLWVKGNDSKDMLTIHYEDNINYTLPAWQRRAHFRSVPLGTLDFTGWRRFRVPVLGDGLQVSGLKGSTDKVDAPIRIMALSVTPAAVPKGAAPRAEKRTIWIDDLAVETQVAPAEMLTLELQVSDPHGRLGADGKLAVCVGNGHTEELKKGKITCQARDAGNTLVWTRTLELPVPAEGFASAEVELAELVARKPHGPVTLEVIFQDPTRAGARIMRPLILKAATQGGIVFDFEEPASYSGFQPGKVLPGRARVEAPGAESSRQALTLPVQPKQANNSVLLHPALPGLVDGVEMQIQGGTRPVTLQVWFIDSGLTGIWLRPYNLYWAEPIQVDWQGWRTVRVPAPPIPPYFGEKNRSFGLKPSYPLNLGLNATLNDGDQPVDIRIDNIRVTTQLPEAEELQIAVDYPDETRIHKPGDPLRLILTNLGSAPLALPVEYQLTSYQGRVARSGKQQVSLPAGGRQRPVLIDALEPGVYDLRVQIAGKASTTASVMVLKAQDLFGPQPTELLGNAHLLRRHLALTMERIYLDWDNSEPVPYLHHANWFEQEMRKRREITQLPRELDGLVAQRDASAAALAAATQAVKTTQEQAAAALRNEKPARDKLANTVKNLATARTERDGIKPTVEAARLKLEMLAKQATEAKMRHEESLKASMQADGDVKSATERQGKKDKELKAAETEVKPAEARKKTAQEQVMAAAQEVQKAEAAVKAAQKEKDPKVLDRARVEEQKARQRHELSQKAVTEAQRTLDLKNAEVQKLRMALETERKSLMDATAKGNQARQSAAAMAKQLEAASKAADAGKAGLTQATQRFEASTKKVADLEKMQDADVQTVKDREKATAEADTQVATAQQMQEKARLEAESASKKLADARAGYDFDLVPVVGFCADWAGPEAAEGLRKGTATRWIPNALQVPQRLVDWSQFVRSIQREYKGRFPAWIFWENPDLDDAPQGIPPAKYGPMLDTFARWVKLYNPEAKVIAGGFNFQKSLTYLQRVGRPDRLAFDEIQVQMNLGELSPEQADVEGYLDELNALLKIRETGRTVRISELDWGIGPYLSPLQQAAYHTRASMILDSRGLPPHQLSLINTGFAYEGLGVFYRIPYGNSAELQTFLPVHIPKPSALALLGIRRFLAEWKYVASVQPGDRSLAYNRAYIYRHASGALTAAVWRTVEGTRLYRLPAAWRGAEARDVFGHQVSLAQGLPFTPLPFLVQLPAGYALEQLRHDLRMLEAVDGSYPVTLDLQLGESDSVKRSHFESTGKGEPFVRGGSIAGDRKVRETYLNGLESELFTFLAPQAGDYLLQRRWYFEGEGLKLQVQLNDGPAIDWDLGKGQGNEAGPRETTLVLRQCRAGKNRVTIRHARSGNCSGYRIEPLTAGPVPLVRLGVLNTRQSRGEILKHSSAAGSPLTFGKTACAEGIGAHANSFIEYPLAGQFSAFEVTVGVDGSTEGRGSVLFRIFVDGKERASSGTLTGFSKPVTLRVDKLESAQRLILSVTDAEDGNRDDLANWVDGKLFLKP
jgi:hypothetical protein